MSLNPSKCSILGFTRKKSLIQHAYMIMGIKFSSLDHHSYLEVEFDKDLSWSLHIKKIYKKSDRTLNFMRRNQRHRIQGICKTESRVLQHCMGPLPTERHKKHGTSPMRARPHTLSLGITRETLVCHHWSRIFSGTPSRKGALLLDRPWCKQ